MAINRSFLQHFASSAKTFFEGPPMDENRRYRRRVLSIIIIYAS